MRPLPSARRTHGISPRLDLDMAAQIRRPLPARRPSQEEAAQPCMKSEPEAGNVPEGAQESQENHRNQESEENERNIEIEIIEELVPEEPRLELPELPRQHLRNSINTPRRQQHLDVEADNDRLTSSAVRGGVANAMLSLSRS